MIPTPLEANGTFTTGPQKTTWLTAVAADTARVTIHTVGTTLGGLPIELAAIGYPAAPATLGSDPGCVLVTAYQHGEEVAAKDAGLGIISDLAYSTDPAVQSYLSSHRVYVIPAVNGDRITSPTRANLKLVDLNRDHLALSQPETRAMNEALNLLNPHIVHDIHEGVNTDLQISGATIANFMVDSALAATMLAMRASAIAYVNTTGQDASPYAMPWFPTVWPNVAGLRNKVAFVTETDRNNTPTDRVAAHRGASKAFLEYHAANAATIATQIAAATAAAAGMTNQFEIEDNILIELPTYYRLTAQQAASTTYVRGSFGITGVPDGDGLLIPTAQTARRVIPYLFDAGSSYRLTTAERVRVPPARGTLTGFERVNFNGDSHTVQRVQLIAGGDSHTVWAGP